MRRVDLAVVCLAAVVVATAAGIGRAEGPAGKSEGKFRVGVFDSRAVAIAYAGSEAHQARVAELMKQYKEAKAAGDQEKAKRLKIEGEAGQALMHEQGFSTASVGDILEQIKDRFPAVAKEANVALIVSKWEVAYENPTVETVDVTGLVVKCFQPKAKAQKWIEDIQTKKPMPILELKILAREKGEKNL